MGTQLVDSLRTGLLQRFYTSRQFYVVLKMQNMNVKLYQIETRLQELVKVVNKLTGEQNIYHQIIKIE